MDKAKIFEAMEICGTIAFYAVLGRNDGVPVEVFCEKLHADCPGSDLSVIRAVADLVYSMETTPMVTVAAIVSMTANTLGAGKWTKA